jgi:hypothetical protein
MAKYRKKPVVIEAVPCSDIISAMEHSWLALPKWVVDAYEDGIITAVNTSGFTVNTLKGALTALRGDMLIKGVAGKLYPCRDSIFIATYDLVEEK